MSMNKIENKFGKLFYLIQSLSKQGRITNEEKGILKGKEIWKKIHKNNNKRFDNKGGSTFNAHIFYLWKLVSQSRGAGG